jgi:hypothetical protein
MDRLPKASMLAFAGPDLSVYPTTLAPLNDDAELNAEVQALLERFAGPWAASVTRPVAMRLGGAKRGGCGRLAARGGCRWRLAGLQHGAADNIAGRHAAGFTGECARAHDRVDQRGMNTGRVAAALVAIALALSPVAAQAQTDAPCEVSCAPLAVVLVGGCGTDLDGATDQFADIRKALVDRNPATVIVQFSYSATLFDGCRAQPLVYSPSDTARDIQVSIRILRETLAALEDACRPQRVVIIGHCLGGLIAFDALDGVPLRICTPNHPAFRPTTPGAQRTSFSLGSRSARGAARAIAFTMSHCARRLRARSSVRSMRASRNGSGCRILLAP